MLQLFASVNNDSKIQERKIDPPRYILVRARILKYMTCQLILTSLDFEVVYILSLCDVDF